MMTGHWTRALFGRCRRAIPAQIGGVVTV